MTESLQAILQFFQTGQGQRPSAETVVTELLTLEKNARYQPATGKFSDLVGQWQLAFITGTKKSQNRAGIVLGKGRYIPLWLGISIAYEQLDAHTGKIINRVKFGAWHLTVTGPAKFIGKKNLLAFDFTRLELKILGLPLYNGYIRNGEIREAKFAQTSIAKQAFFSFFLLSEKAIAARGREGGLAVWIK
ncbi:MAG: hypothetical protein ACRC6M_13225 [Microcystaceae cyanobacterium]